MQNIVNIDSHNLGSLYAERLCKHFVTSTAKNFKDEDILELFLYSCGAEQDSNILSKQLLTSFGSFSNILTAPHNKLAAVDGMNERTVAALKLVSEFALRLIKKEVEHSPVLTNKKALIKYCKALLSHLKIEQFHIFYLDTQKRLIVDEMMSEGTVNHAPVYTREVVKRTLNIGASSVILVHNHPSGKNKPSSADKKITMDISMALATLGIEVDDHIIIAKSRYFSFYDNGLM